MAKPIEIRWLAEPEDHDYPAALSYLCLMYDDKISVDYVGKLGHARWEN